MEKIFENILSDFGMISIAANRINHADVEFDADYATVVGTKDREYMLSSFISLEDLYDKRGEFPMTDDEHNRRVADGQA